MSEDSLTDGLTIDWLGRISYQDGLALQSTLHTQRLAGEISDRILLLEHDPVYTIGRNPDQSSLGNQETLPFPVVTTNRGGQGTFHGPGQLVGYPILDLNPDRRDLHRYLRTLEQVLIDFCRSLGITATRSDGQTGIWVGERKLASIGVGVRKWITMHGFALNVCGDLSPFNAITPCGIQGVEMTSLELESDQEITVENTAHSIQQFLTQHLDKSET